jgi:hypothetical protein
MGAITEEQCRHLMSLTKHFTDESTIELGENWIREVKSDDDRELFLLDYYKGRAELKKFVVNNRYRTTIVLARFCSYKRHTNPDGTVFEGPHLHLYDEDYADAIAYPVSELGLKETFSLVDGFSAFIKYCNIDSVPGVQLTLEA